MGLILPLSNLGYRKNSMKVKIAMFVPASVYDLVTLTAARSSLIKWLHSDDARADRRQAPARGRAVTWTLRSRVLPETIPSSSFDYLQNNRCYTSNSEDVKSRE